MYLPTEDRLSTENSVVSAGKSKMLAPATNECYFTEHLYFILYLKNTLAKASFVLMI